MRLIHISECKNGISIDSNVHFKDLTDRHVVASSDPATYVRMGRLLKISKEKTLSLSHFTGEASVELTTSDQRVADLLGIQCQSKEDIAHLTEYTRHGTNTLLEPIVQNGRISFRCHLCNDGLETICGELYHFNAFHQSYRDMVLTKPTCFITITTLPDLYVDYSGYAKEMAKTLEYFLNDAYVYQEVQRKHVSEWKFGTLASICNLVGRDYREALYPHLANACSFMTERAAIV